MKSTYYRDPIILFGFALPAVVFAAVLGGGYLLLQNCSDYLGRQQTQFRAYEVNLRGMRQLEQQLGKKKDHLGRWNDLLSADTGTAFSANLRSISDSIPGEEFSQTSLEQMRTGAGFASASAQNSSQVHLSTRGTFRATQKAMLQMETKMPQLQLQELKIDVSATSSSALNFQFGYTAWEK
jgi:hypothetical protein